MRAITVCLKGYNYANACARDVATDKLQLKVQCIHSGSSTGANIKLQLQKVIAYRREFVVLRCCEREFLPTLH